MSLTACLILVLVQAVSAAVLLLQTEGFDP